MDGYVLTTGQATGLPDDLVAEVAGVLEFYGCDMGPLGPDAAARAILAARSWQDRRAAEERRHTKAHEQASREVAALLGLVEARERTRRRTALDDVL